MDFESVRLISLGVATLLFVLAVAIWGFRYGFKWRKLFTDEQDR